MQKVFKISPNMVTLVVVIFSYYESFWIKAFGWNLYLPMALPIPIVWHALSAAADLTQSQSISANWNSNEHHSKD